MHAHVETEKLAFVGFVVTREERTMAACINAIYSVACVLSLTLQCGNKIFPPTAEQTISCEDCIVNII